MIGVPPRRGRTCPRVMGIVRPAPSRGGGASPPAIERMIGGATRPAGGGKKIIAHVANDATGKWGRGFGLALTRAFDGIRDDFLRWSRHNLRLGNAHVFNAGDDLAVFSMVAQKGLPDSRRRTIRYAHLAACLDELAGLSRRTAASVHMPIRNGLRRRQLGRSEGPAQQAPGAAGRGGHGVHLPGSKRPAPTAGLTDCIAGTIPGAQAWQPDSRPVRGSRRHRPAG